MAENKNLFPQTHDSGNRISDAVSIENEEYKIEIEEAKTPNLLTIEDMKKRQKPLKPQTSNRNLCDSTSPFVY